MARLHRLQSAIADSQGTLPETLPTALAGRGQALEADR